MLKYWLLLAAVAAPDSEIPGLDSAPSKTSGLHLQDILLVAGVVILLALLLFIWVYVTRKNRRPQYGEGGSKVIYKLDKKDLDRSTRRMKHRRRRPNHPDNLPRNPTLAEAGGLPPVRPDDPSESAH